jgi:dihydroorotate dehydrogenase (NAD+) catalytic subunit
MAVDLRTRLGHVELPNPILTASGCAGAGRELAQFFDVAKIGAVVTKSVMAAPRAGRPTPRMAETPSGMLNSIGLQGPGIDAFLQRDLPWLLSRGARAVVSIAGGSVDEYAELAARLTDAAGVTAIEVNISCPNVEDRGQVFACDPGASAAVIEAVRARVRYDVPVFAKLSPDVTDIVTIARACVGAGADGLSMINTLLGMAIDTETMRPVLAGVTGGLSGPAIRPVAVRCIWQVRKALPDVPIIGMGGVRTGRDAHGERRHDDLPRPVGLRPHPARARRGTRAAWRRAAGRRDRARARAEGRAGAPAVRDRPLAGRRTRPASPVPEEES